MLHGATGEFFHSFKQLQEHYHCIVVHGGGPKISNLMEKLEIESVFHNGHRKTTAETLEIVEMVLGGHVNVQVTSNLMNHDISCLGIKGCDGLLTAELIDEATLGFVGQVKQVEKELLIHCLKGGYVPVVAPLGRTETGMTVNINADLAAAAIAKDMQAEKLLYVTDVPGILHEEQLVETTTAEDVKAWISQGVIHGGMVPKVEAAVSSLSDHLKEVVIVSGEQPLLHSNKIKGTSIYAK